MYQENYIIDRNGKKIAVQIPLNVFKKLVADSEELEDIKEFRKAKKNKSDPLPIDEAFNIIDNQ